MSCIYVCMHLLAQAGHETVEGVVEPELKPFWLNGFGYIRKTASVAPENINITSRRVQGH